MSEAPQKSIEIEIPIGTTQFEGKPMRYRTPNNLTEWRVDTLFLEEPDTVRWLSCMEPGEVLIDIGANVGMYSTLAAIGRGMRVFAFEPESQNYSLLNQNIYLNDVADKVTAFCGALSDTDGLSTLHLAHMDAGGAFHASGESLDFNLEPMRSSFAQGCVLMTLDRLVEQGTVPMPDHIKLDVDGFEHKVVNGMMNTIKNPKVKSVAIELNPTLAEHRQVFSQMAELGFSYFDNQRAESCLEEGPFKDIGNVIFYRPSWPAYEALYQCQIGPMRVEKSISEMAEKIEQTPPLDSATDHFIVEDIFPAEFYQNLLNNLPSEELYKSEQGKTLKVFNLDETDINRLPGSEMPFWSQLNYELNSVGFLSKIATAFEGKLTQSDSNNLKLSASIVRGAELELSQMVEKPLISLCFSLDGDNRLLAYSQSSGVSNIEKLSSKQVLVCSITV